MASGDTKTEHFLDVLANGSRADIPTDNCCNTKTQNYILGAVDRMISLEEEVEELQNNPDVTDIVSTYQDLTNYDKTTLTDGDVIRVLTDSTHDDESAYYRYNAATDSFDYIGTTRAYTDFVGTSGGMAGAAGLVPAPQATDADKFLKSDGTWATVSGGGGEPGDPTINDNSVAGNHIFEATKEEAGILWGAYISGNGTIVDNANWGYTPTYIPIRTGDTLFVTNVKKSVGQMYDSDMEPIGNIWTESNIQDFNITLQTENVAYVRLNFPAGYDHIAKVNDRNVLNKFSIPWLKVKSDNLELDQNSVDGAIITDSSLANNKLILDSGLATTNGQIWSQNFDTGKQRFVNYDTWRRITEPISVSAGDVIVGKNTRATWILAYNSNDIVTGSAPTNTGIGDHTFTVPSGTSYIGVNIFKELASGFELYINGERVAVDLGERQEIGWLKLNDEQKASVTYDYSRFSDLKTLFIGDSITGFNFRAQKNWVRYITEWLGMTNYTNGGMSGTGLKRPSGGNPNWVEKLPSYGDGYELILIMGDMNDWSHQDFNATNMGQYGDATTNTFYGTLKVYLEALQAKYPLAKIGWITSTPRNQLVDGTSTDYLHGRNSIFEQANSVIKEMCNNYCIPVLELYHEANLYPWINANNEEFFKADTGGSYEPDAIHPNSKGHKIMAYKIKDFILRNF